MSYRAVVDAINKHGGALDKSSYSFGNKSNNIGATTSKTTSVNPYSSNAYTLGDYRGFANSQPDIEHCTVRWEKACLHLIKI